MFDKMLKKVLPMNFVFYFFKSKIMMHIFYENKNILSEVVIKGGLNFCRTPNFMKKSGISSGFT